MAHPLIVPTERLITTHSEDTLPGQLARAKLNAILGRQKSSAVSLDTIIKRCGNSLETDESILAGILEIAVLTCRLDLAAEIINRRFGTRDWFRVELKSDEAAFVHVLTPHVSGLSSARFLLSEALTTSDRIETVVRRWISTLEIFASYYHQGVVETGVVTVNLGDHGDVPGLAFCERQAEYFLLPDPYFISTRGYKDLRLHLADNEVPWSRRNPVALWRGATTGDPFQRCDWRSLPRIRLCEIGRRNPDLIDAGITNIVQISDALADEEIRTSDLMGAFVPAGRFSEFKFQIDIDGNTNSWPGLFQKLLTGSTVLKVASPHGYQQWYYEQLKPWINFVPVESDMSDLLEKIRWLRTHDEAACSIGQQGRFLALSMDYEGELQKASHIITAALRHFKGRTDIDPGSEPGSTEPISRVRGPSWTSETASIAGRPEATILQHERPPPQESQRGAVSPSSGEHKVSDPNVYNIDFSISGTGHEFLTHGWSFAETNFTWTLGAESIITFPPVAADSGYVAHIIATPTQLRGHRQRAIFRLNGHLLASIVARSPIDISLYVPKSTIAGAASVVLHMEWPDAVSPSEVGSSDDPRRLAFAFHRLTFSPLELDPPGMQERRAPVDTDVLLDFQSLGANCELGFVQRHVGAEPLGLFRWASSTIPSLISALRHRFDGLGDPNNTRIILDDASEFQIIDARFGFKRHSHAYANKGAISSDVFKREIARIQFLVRKMLGELTEATKIFVFHDAGRSDEEAVLNLLHSIRDYNSKNCLLWVRPVEGSHEPGDVNVVADGLLVGYLDRFEPLGDVGQNVSYDCWIRICRAAHQLWHDGRTGTETMSGGLAPFGSSIPSDGHVVRPAGKDHLPSPLTVYKPRLGHQPTPIIEPPHQPDSPAAGPSIDTPPRLVMHGAAIQPSINIVLTIDDDYTDGFLVTILSVLSTTQRELCLFVLSTQTDRNRLKVERILRTLGVRFTVTTKEGIDTFFEAHPMSPEQIRRDPHYYRLFAPNLFPELERAIYLDSDLVVRSDIGQLWDLRLDDCIAAGTEDPSFLGPQEAEFRAAFGGKYFNTGVLLIDFGRWRAERVTEISCDWITEFLRKDNTGIWRQFWDQSPLNMALRNKWMSLSPTWNFTIRTQPDHASSYGLTTSQYDAIAANPNIFHFLGAEKPWRGDFTQRSTFFAEYHRYDEMVRQLDCRSVEQLGSASPARLMRPADQPADFTATAERVFQRLSTLASPVHFVQVGAHDGVSGDPIHKFVKEFGWTGLLIEPVPYIFERLLRNYAGVPGLQFENICVGPTAGTATFYSMKPRNPEPVSWYSQLSSFRRDVILKHSNDIPDIEEWIAELQLPVDTLESLLSERGCRVDALIVDTEGFDAQVLRSVDLAKYDPSVIYFECKHLAAEEASDMKARLRSLGYILQSDGINVIAVKQMLLSDDEVCALSTREDSSE